MMLAYNPIMLFPKNATEKSIFTKLVESQYINLYPKGSAKFQSDAAAVLSTPEKRGRQNRGPINTGR
jgi:hypothetical protein